MCHQNTLTTRLSLLFQNFSSPGCVWFAPWFLHDSLAPSFLFYLTLLSTSSFRGRLNRAVAVRAKSAPHRSRPSGGGKGWDQQILLSLRARMFSSAYNNACRSAPPFLERQFSSSLSFTPLLHFIFIFLSLFPSSFLVLILYFFPPTFVFCRAYDNKWVTFALRRIYTSF